MSKFNQYIQLCLEQFSQIDYAKSIDMPKLENIAKGLGPSIYRADTALISCADSRALERLKQRFLIQKMGFNHIEDGILAKAIEDVCELMRPVNTKRRAVFYYLLLDVIEKRDKQADAEVVNRSFSPMAFGVARSVAAPTNSSGFFEHTVARGETLFRIASQNGMTVEELKLLNNLTSDTIPLGRVLRVRRRTTRPTVPTPPTPPPTPPAQTYLDRRRETVISSREMTEFIAKIGDTVVNLNNKYRLYTFSFVTPQGMIQNISFRDNYMRSRHMDRDFPQGIFYFSSYKPDLVFVRDIVRVAKIDLTMPQLEALMFTSLHEGNFDAVSSFDRCIFSFGFIQFIAWTKEGFPGSLNTLLQSIKTNEAALFDKYFFKLGMDMESGVFTVLDDKGLKLRSKDAWRYVQSNYQLTAAFIRSAYEPALQKEQLRCAKFYIDDFNRVIRELKSAPLQKLVNESQAALNLLVSLCINRGGGGLTVMLRKALPKMTLFTEAELFNVILENESADARVVNRINMAKESRTILA
jgi:hypothetical protein